MEQNKPLILITNDDGINARGVFYLAEAVKEGAKCPLMEPLMVTVNDFFFKNVPVRSFPHRYTWWINSGNWCSVFKYEAY